MPFSSNISFTAILANPWSAITAIFLGYLTGRFFPLFGLSLSPIGQIFIGLLRMCVLPLMITAIVSSLGLLVRNHRGSGLLKRIVFVFFIGLLLTSSLGAIVSIANRPKAAIGPEAMQDIGRLLFRSDQVQPAQPTETTPKVTSFFIDMVPINIFAALAEGHGLRILIFTIFIGIALGTINLSSANDLLVLSSALCEGFKRIIGWMLYVLPFGLFSIFAELAAKPHSDLFKILLPLIANVVLASVVMLTIYIVIISYKTHMMPWKVISALKRTLLISLGTGNSFVALATAMVELEQKLSVKREITNLVMPLGIILNRQGVVLIFVLSTFYVSQLYQLSLGFQGIMIAIMGSTITGAAALGRIGIAASLLEFVLSPLGLPPETAICVLISLEAVFEPIAAIVIVLANTASTLLIQTGE